MAANDESSANPEALFDYHRLATELKAGLLHDADVLEQTLIDFCASCTEYDTGVTPAAADLLRDHAYEIGALGEFVKEVGLDFLAADAGALDALPGGPGCAASAALIRATPRVDDVGLTPAPQPTVDRSYDAIEALRLERAEVQAPTVDRSFDAIEDLRAQRGTPPPPPDRSYDAIEELRAQWGAPPAVLPSVPGYGTAAQSPSIAPPAPPPVSAWSTQEKVIEALKRAGKYLPGEGLARLQELLSPQTLAAFVGALLLWGASHAFGVGWVADGGLLIAGTIFLGLDAWRGGAELGRFLQSALSAQSEADLDAAGQHFAAGFTILGVDVLMAWAARFRPVKGGSTPPITERSALTPQGVRLSVPAVEEPAPGALGRFERVVKAFKKQRNGPSAENLRNTPGTVTGGENLPDLQAGQRWIRDPTGNGLEADIPGQLARTLRGQTFNTFDDFRKAFWKAAADDPELQTQFRSQNLQSMRDGKAPVAPQAEHHGKHDSFILHHKLPIQHGGAVYDVDNLKVVSPRRHQNILPRDYHFGDGVSGK